MYADDVLYDHPPGLMTDVLQTFSSLCERTERHRTQTMERRRALMPDYSVGRLNHMQRHSAITQCSQRTFLHVTFTVITFGCYNTHEMKLFEDATYRPPNADLHAHGHTNIRELFIKRRKSLM